MTAQDYLNTHKDRFLQELLEFLRIPSISSLREHTQDVRDAATWVQHRLEQAGMEHVQVLETGGHPVVYADYLHADAQPTILIYGHFDTQPVDPLELWSNPPFEPTLKNDRVYARGASDDKGNMLTPILALESLLQTVGSLPVNVKVLFEGQEEIGSPELPAFVAAHRDLLACDLVVSADGGQWDESQPALLVGLRGMCALEVEVKGAVSDLHSGSYGGAVQNPLHVIAGLIASLHDAEGRVAVDGFYDGVRDLTAEDRAMIAQVPFDLDAYKTQLGIDDVFGEAGYSTLERIWARPTLEVNGLYGGFQGEGVKTVLPNRAHAKLTCRLVADQDPAQVVASIRAHIERMSPAGVTVTVTPEESSARAYLMPAKHPGLQAAKRVHEVLYGKSPYYTRSGGSIPFCSLMLDTLGVYTVNFAFGLRDENAHAPDEFYRLSSFYKAQQAYVMLLHELKDAALSNAS